MAGALLFGVPDKTEYLREQLRMYLARRAGEEVEWQDITEFRVAQLGVPEHRDNTRKYFKALEEYYDAGWVREPVAHEENAGPSTTVLRADGSTESEGCFVVPDADRLADSEYLLRLHGYDPERFELVSARHSRWGGEKSCYSSKICLRPRVRGVTREDIETWFERLRANPPAPVRARELEAEGDRLLLLPVSDLHFAMRATLAQTGNEYDRALAQQAFEYVLSEILGRVKQMGHGFSKVVFTIGGDMANADNLAGTTTKGTPQDMDGGYFEISEQLYAMTVRAIVSLAELAPVDVVWIPSNHDLTVGYCLAKYCEAWFAGDERVSVDCSPAARKYFVFGDTLFALTHDGDLKKLPKLIPDEARALWSGVRFCEVFTQHLHSEMVLLEENSMRIQRLPSICARSAWAAKEGFSSRRQCKAFVFDSAQGLTDVLYVTIK